MGGITTTHALGFNYADKWGEKFTITGSYFANNSDNDALRNTFRQYSSARAGIDDKTENEWSTSNNTNLRINLRIGYNTDSANSIFIRPRLSFQTNRGSYYDTIATFFQNRLLISTRNNTTLTLT